MCQLNLMMWVSLLHLPLTNLPNLDVLATNLSYQQANQCLAYLHSCLRVSRCQHLMPINQVLLNLLPKGTGDSGTLPRNMVKNSFLFWHHHMTISSLWAALSYMTAVTAWQEGERRCCCCMWQMLVLVVTCFLLTQKIIMSQFGSVEPVTNKWWLKKGLW